MFRNLQVRNWKANYRMARRTSIISHFQIFYGDPVSGGATGS